MRNILYFNEVSATHRINLCFYLSNIAVHGVLHSEYVLRKSYSRLSINTLNSQWDV